PFSNVSVFMVIVYSPLTHLIDTGGLNIPFFLYASCTICRRSILLFEYPTVSIPQEVHSPSVERPQRGQTLVDLVGVPHCGHICLGSQRSHFGQILFTI